MEEQRQSMIFAEHPSSLKDLLLHSATVKNKEITVHIAKSRFRKILSDYHAINGIHMTADHIDYCADHYRFYILSGFDSNGNIYKIIKNATYEEYKGQCTNCTCGKKRMIDGESKECYYKIMITKDYTTKIK